MWMSAIVHKQNIYTKPHSTTHPIGLALNYPPNNIKLDTFVNNTNSPSHILPFKMCCMLNQAVSVGELDHSRWLHICNRIPCPKEIKKLFTKINSCHTKQPPKTCQRGWAIKWCMHTHIHMCIYIYKNIIYTFPYKYKCSQKSSAPMLCMQCVACIGWPQDLSAKSILCAYIGIAPRKTVMLGNFNLMQTQ